MITRMGIRTRRAMHARVICLVFGLLHLEAMVRIGLGGHVVCARSAVVILVDLTMDHRVGRVGISTSRSGVVHGGSLGAVGRRIWREVHRLRVVWTGHGGNREMLAWLRKLVQRVVRVVVHALVSVVDVQVLARKGAGRRSMPYRAGRLSHLFVCTVLI